MTEALLKELLNAVHARIKADLKHIHAPERGHILMIVEDELRSHLATGTLPPHNFPAGLIHEDDYYSEETEEPKIAVTTPEVTDYGDALDGWV